MKQEFEMTQGEMDDIIAINKKQMPVLKIGNVITGMDLQEKINNYWEGLGDKYGFKNMTVESSAKGKLFFLAEPKPIVIPKTEAEKQMDKYIGESMGYRNNHVTDALTKIVEQIEKLDYQFEGDFLKMNVAFLSLKKIAGC